MPHTYVSALFHCVFSTKERRKMIIPEVRTRLWAFIGGIARKNQFKALSVGGTDDHAHVLLSLPATLHVAKAVQLIKGGSSKWLHDTFPDRRLFAWQEGYGAFSIGISQVRETIAYIENQESHHRRRTFEDEIRVFLKKNEIAYDERYILG